MLDTGNKTLLPKHFQRSLHLVANSWERLALLKCFIAPTTTVLILHCLFYVNVQQISMSMSAITCMEEVNVRHHFARLLFVTREKNVLWVRRFTISMPLTSTADILD